MTDSPPPAREDAPDETYRSTSQQRLLAVMLALAGREVDGLRPGAIAKGLGTHPSNVTHDLRNLRIAGLAEQIPDTDAWRLSPRLAQIATDMLTGLDRAERKAAEVRQRFTRSAR
jgi:DNA-binding IclR family transcriptional regulator